MQYGNKKINTLHNSSLRIASTSYVKLVGDYYGSDNGTWKAPEVRESFPPDREYELDKSVTMVIPDFKDMAARCEARRNAARLLEKAMMHDVTTMNETITGRNSGYQMVEAAMPVEQ